MQKQFKILSILAVILMSIPAFAAVPTVCIGKNNIVKLEVASTSEQVQRGLMFRTSLAEGSGMVFLFHPAAPQKFWMYHCFISLDMCFVLNDHIVKIFENVPPCKAENPNDCPTYPGPGPGITVSEVIELPAGYCKKHGIKEGDKITFQL
jgi:uncharacterized membrane protein (UPF0127 family)